LSKFYLQFIVSLVVAFFAPLGVAASESANQQNSSSGISLWKEQASLGVSTRLGQTTRQTPTPQKPKSKSFGDHDAKAILTVWRWTGNNNENHELETPTYNVVFDYSCTGQQELRSAAVNEALITPFFFSYVQSNHRISGWKDGNTLYVFLNTQYA
jgi:hypothetical protein